MFGGIFSAALTVFQLSSIIVECPLRPNASAIFVPAPSDTLHPLLAHTMLVFGIPVGVVEGM